MNQSPTVDPISDGTVDIVAKEITESHGTIPNWNSPGIATPLLPPELFNYLQMPEKKSSQPENSRNPRKKSKKGKEVSKYVNAHKLLLDKVCLLSEK